MSPRKHWQRNWRRPSANRLARSSSRSRERWWLRTTVLSLVLPSSRSATFSCVWGPRPSSSISIKKNGYEGSSVTCPGCDRAAAYHDDAERTLVSLFGPLTYERAYYYCRRC